MCVRITRKSYEREKKTHGKSRRDLNPVVEAAVAVEAKFN